MKEQGEDGEEMEELLMMGTVYIAFPIALLAVAVYGVNSIRRKDRCYWVLLGITLGSFLLLWGGNKLLGSAWRNRPALILGLAAMMSFLACVWYVAVRGWKKYIPRAVLVLCAMALSSAGLFLGLWGIFVTYGGEERVLAHEGRLLVEVDRSFLDPMYDYYEYRGPLFRGSREVYSTVGWERPRLEDDGTA